MPSKTHDHSQRLLRHWSYRLALVCALLVAGALMLTSQSARARSLSEGQHSASQRQSHNGMGRLSGTGEPGDNRMKPSAGKSSVGQPPSMGEAPAQPDRRPSWNLVDSSNVFTTENELLVASAVSANNIWAGGYYCLDAACNTYHTLIEHWNGSTWSIVSSPNVDAGGYVRGIAAVSANNVWMVGFSCLDSAGCTTFTTLIEHWNGTSWSVVPGPDTGAGNSILRAISAHSANDIWAVGSRNTNASTLTEHWNGTAWSIVPSPNPGSVVNRFQAVDVHTSRDVWAVGFFCTDSDCTYPQTLTEHWNGTAWSVVPSPNVGTFGSLLLGTFARSANDVWAVGYYCTDSDCNGDQTLIEHWNGTAWSVVPSPNVGTVHTVLHEIVALAPDDAWATWGYCDEGTCPNLMLHWDGHTWSVYPISSPGTLDNGLNAFAVVGHKDIWGVGYMNSGSGYRTQVQHFTNHDGH